MSGSSKSKNIKRRKEAQDAKRSKMFSKASRAIHAAILQGGSNDPSQNAQLRLALQEAKKVNMPKGNITRALQKGEGGTQNYTSLQFEGYGAGGVAIQVHCLTDNINRTVAKVRSHFNKHNARMAKVGSLQHVFVQRGILGFSKEGLDEDTLLEWMMVYEIEEFSEEADVFHCQCPPEHFHGLTQALDEKAIVPQYAELKWMNLESCYMTEPRLETLERWLSLLEEDEDVLHVHHNAQASVHSNIERPSV